MLPALFSFAMLYVTGMDENVCYSNSSPI